MECACCLLAFFVLLCKFYQAYGLFLLLIFGIHQGLHESYSFISSIVFLRAILSIL